MLLDDLSMTEAPGSPWQRRAPPAGAHGSSGAHAQPGPVPLGACYASTQDAQVGRALLPVRTGEVPVLLEHLPCRGNAVELRSMAAWLDLDSVVVEGRSGFAQRLAAAVRA